MKKKLALLLALVMTLSLSACGSGSSDKSQADDGTVSGKITYLTNRTDLDADGTYDKLIAQFNEEYPDVEVEVQSITNYADELATRMQTTEYGDVLMIPDAVPSNSFSNYFEPFGTVDELSDTYKEDYLYSKWYDDQVYGLAYMCTVHAVPLQHRRKTVCNIRNRLLLCDQQKYEKHGSFQGFRKIYG